MNQVDALKLPANAPAVLSLMTIAADADPALHRAAHGCLHNILWPHTMHNVGLCYNVVCINRVRGVACAPVRLCAYGPTRRRK